MELAWIKRIDSQNTYYVDKYGVVYDAVGDKLKQTKCAGGYLSVGIDGRRQYVHRLVAMYFIPNPLNHPIINHKDGNRQNNTVDNLEWCTQKYNVLHAIKVLGKTAGKNKKRVLVYEYESGKQLGVFESVKEAAETLGLPLHSCYHASKGSIKLVRRKYVIKCL